MPKASSCMFVLPRMTAPASTSFWTVGAFAFGMNPRSAGVPAVFGSPATCVLSFATRGRQRERQHGGEASEHDRLLDRDMTGRCGLASSRLREYGVRRAMSRQVGAIARSRRIV